MNYLINRYFRILFIVVGTGALPLAARSWHERDCIQEPSLADKLPRHRIYRDVVPMGYPYANYWVGEPYLAPFAGPVRYEQGRLFMFGWAY